MSWLYLSNPCAFFLYFSTRQCGRSRRPAFPAPSLEGEGHRNVITRENQAAGTKAFARDRVCVRSSRQGMNPLPCRLREGLCAPLKRNCELPLTP
jgi:hypothetical protein